LAAVSSAGNSATQGGHHVAQKLINSGVPRNLSRRRASPSLSRIDVDIGGVGAAVGGAPATAKSGHSMNADSPRKPEKTCRRAINAVFGAVFG
jgi:hypothetical protein